MKIRALFLILSLFLILCSLQCAKIEFPPGGPADITPPEILSSMPYTGQLEVSRDSEIRIEFSEKISKEDLQAQVYIVPEPENPPLINIKNRALVIEFRDSLLADQTYLISLKTGLADLRRNKLKRPFKLAFSTGTTIDQGKISGRVYKDFKPALNVDVWAFRADSTFTVFDRKPDYITQTNDSGEYRFEYLSDGRYLCFGIEDTRADRKYDPLTDFIGIPISDLVLDPNNREHDNFDFNLLRQDTASLKLVSAKYTADKLILLKFSALIKASDLSPANFEILSVQNNLALGSYDILCVSDTTDNVFLVPGEIPEYGSYNLTAKSIISLDKRDISTTQNSAVIKIDSISDANPPALLTFYPPDNYRSFPADSVLRFTFSEPVIVDSSIRATFKLESNDSSTYSEFEYFADKLNLIIKLQDSLREGQTYVFSIELARVRDLSGNAMIDSIRQIKF